MEVSSIKSLANNNNNNNCLFSNKNDLYQNGIEDKPQIEGTNYKTKFTPWQIKLHFLVPEMKPLAKQNVKYDSATGKVYEELGSSGTNNRNSPQQPQHISSQLLSPNATTDYHSSSSFQQGFTSYPCNTQNSHYMGSFGANGTYPTFNPYDR